MTSQPHLPNFSSSDAAIVHVRNVLNLDDPKYLKYTLFAILNCTILGVRYLIYISNCGEKNDGENFRLFASKFRGECGVYNPNTNIK